MRDGRGNAGNRWDSLRSAHPTDASAHSTDFSAHPDSIPFAANDVRLSPREWFIAAGLIVGVMYFVPIVWQRIEPFEPEADYRIAYSLGNDYWMYDRSCRQLCSGESTVVLGDSVVWGHYVAKDETLTHYLNRLVPEGRFVNLGVDGIHPAAMEGLVRHYGRAMAGQKVLVQCNLLWISSPRRDLTEKKESAFNHPSLVPQFWPRIPCYTESLSRKLGIVVDRQLPFAGWSKHLEIAYFDSMDLASWTYEHPYADPAAAVTLRLPPAGEMPSPPPVARPWTEQGMSRFKAQWVDLENSFQWRCFRETLDLLAARGNRVFVLLGPLNKHMLTDDCRPGYELRTRQAAEWLAARGIPHHVAKVLPSDLYADASHPVAAGYGRLAEELAASKSFRRFQGQSVERP